MAPRPTPLSMEFSRQKYWSGLPFSTLGDPNLGIEPMSPLSPPLQADYLPSESHKGINICKALNMVLVYSRCPIKASCCSASYHFIIEYVFFHFLFRPLGFKGLRSHRGRLSREGSSHQFQSQGDRGPLGASIKGLEATRKVGVLCTSWGQRSDWGDGVQSGLRIRTNLGPRSVSHSPVEPDSLDSDPCCWPGIQKGPCHGSQPHS